MQHYLAEVYLSRKSSGRALARLRNHARSAARAVSRDGSPVLYLSSAYLPDEELLFLLYGAESVTAVESALARAQLAHPRVHEAVAL